MKVKITYNSPVVLTFSIISALVLLYSIYVKNLTGFLALPGNFDFSSPMNYLRLVTYTFVHATAALPGQSNFGHFIGNFTIILLLGPILEEKYGGKDLIFMMVVAAVVTGILHIIFSNSMLLGSSGLAFMLIILCSFPNYRKGDLPLTFLVICIFFLGKEVLGAFQNDNVSQLAHIAGGAIGAVFGFYYKKS